MRSTTSPPDRGRRAPAISPSHVAFDHEQVDLVLVDARPGDDERDVTTKRFPTWGDAADLIDVLDVQPEGELRYRAAARNDWRRPVVEGSQILGQAIVAAEPPRARSAGRVGIDGVHPGGRRARSRTPSTSTRSRTGRTFTTLGVRATQGGADLRRRHVLLDVTAPDVIRHADPAPDVRRTLRVRRPTTCP